MTEMVLEQKFPDSQTNGLSKIPALFSSVPQLLLRHDEEDTVMIRVKRLTFYSQTDTFLNFWFLFYKMKRLETRLQRFWPAKVFRDSISKSKPCTILMDAEWDRNQLHHQL